MNTHLAKKLMITESPIYHDGIEYKKIQALVFKKTKSGIVACAELLDKNSKSLTTVFLKDIQTDEISESKSIDIDEIYFQGLQAEFKSNALTCINNLGIPNYKNALTHIRGVISVISDLEDLLDQKVAAKENK